MPVILMTVIGPLIVKLAPWLAMVPGLSQIKRWLGVATYVAVLGAGVWAGVELTKWWHGDMLTQRQAAAATRSALEKAALDAKAAEIDARNKALTERVAILEAREREVAGMAAQQADFLDQLEKDRGDVESDRTPVLRADDQWLRAWQRRGR